MMAKMIRWQRNLQAIFGLGLWNFYQTKLGNCSKEVGAFCDTSASSLLDFGLRCEPSISSDSSRFGSYKCVKSHLWTILRLRRLGLDKRNPEIAETPPQWRAAKLSESEITTLRRSERSRGRCSLNYSPIRFSLTFRGAQHCRMSSLSSALKKEALCHSPSSNSTAPPWIVYFYIGILSNIWCAL
ncbi:unnamed protein product [Brassica napus]|nr:unnamed protein product [Brassica napus]